MSPTKLNARPSQPDFGPIKSTTTSELPSAKWDRNSCWLDSSMEVLFCAMAFHNTFKEFENLVLTEKTKATPAPIYYLYLAFKFRLDQGLNKFLAPSHGEASEITEVRNSFRQTLHTIKAVNGKVGEFQMAFVSI